MNRREFISAISAAGASLACSRLALARTSGEPLSVMIIGAGISGLVAGYELTKAGHQVRILEAQRRSGGRVHTLRDLADGQYADMGAARIPKSHDLTHRYIKEFNLPLIPFYPSRDKFMIIENGRASAVEWNRFTAATGMVMSLGSPDRWSKISGGNDLLPTAFARSLGSRITYNSPVRKVEQNASSVSVTFTAGDGSHQTIRGDVLVCAIPLTMLRRIQFQPELPQAKARLISTAEYDSASRVFLQTKTRFWQQQQLNGFGFGEHGDEVWDSSFGEPGQHGILQSYVRGSFSRTLRKISLPERIAATTKSLDKLFPGLEPNVEKGFSKCWDEDPWVQGAWAHLSGEEMNVVMKPEGRIHFAGEHVSVEPSWMQGALQSGLRVVNEIRSAASMYRSSYPDHRSIYHSA